MPVTPFNISVQSGSEERLSGVGVEHIAFPEATIWRRSVPPRPAGRFGRTTPLELSSSPRARSAREAAYWNETYGCSGSEHLKYLWTRRLAKKSYVSRYFDRLVASLREKRILSIGGGVDALGVFLAHVGNQVTTVDVSAVAATSTRELAEARGIKGNLITLVTSVEEVEFGSGAFDVVIAKRALHHMDIACTVERVHKWLVAGGVFWAEEPVCLLRLLEWIHRKAPFHPSAPRTPEERELTDKDLRLIRYTFGRVKVRYFDFLARESIAYFVSKSRMDWLLNPLGKIDYLLMNQGLPILRRVGTYAIIEARK